METSLLKKFATEARNVLIKGVVDRLKSLGFDENGKVNDMYRPEKIQGGALFLNRTVGEDFYAKWCALENAVEHHPHGAKIGVRQVAEEAAYTWFNRFVAIRILQKNGLIEPQIAYAAGGRIPLIVENARHGRIPVMDDADRAELDELLDDDSKVLEQFALLIVAYCHSTPILSKCFGHIDDYTELLLPQDILTDGGFVWMLNNTTYITDEDYKQTELIGWLYQFYISEKKDEVFASFKKKKKAEAEDIPAATQIFTPNWIVKYMVQNTLGRIYLDNKPNSSLAQSWKYLVDSRHCEELGDEAIQSTYRFTELDQLKVADFACGSGHILNEFFDMLYSFYMEDDYSSTEAIESIFKNNLIGIDLDTRAKQLSMFSLLLKACQKNARFVDATVLPRVYDMPDPITDKEWLRETLPHYFLGGTDRVIKESTEALKLMESAKNLGSTMVFRISSETRNAIAEHIDIWKENGNEDLQNLVRSFRIILALTDKYSAIAMNPPYMEGGKMNAELSDYVLKFYQDYRNDLFSVFMKVAESRLQSNALYSMINMDNWTFKSSFEPVRVDVLSSVQIINLVLLGARTFDEISGEVVQNVVFTIKKTLPSKDFSYLDVSECTSSENKKNCFLQKKDVENNFVNQSEFIDNAGSKIYLLPSAIMTLVKQSKRLNEYGCAKQGLATGCNDLFTRIWYEVDHKKIGYGFSSVKDTIYSDYTWYPYNKGGTQRRWYGNQELVVNWAEDGKAIKSFVDEKGKLRSRPQNMDFYFRKSISWGLISGPYFRSFPKGFIYDIQGMSFFTNDEDYYKVLGWLNSSLFRFIGRAFNPREQYQSGDLMPLPFIRENIDDLVKNNVAISKADWDAYETSWDFQKNELLAMTLEDEDANVQFDIDEAAKCGKMLCIDRAAPEPESLSWRMRVYQGKWERLFKQLHANEEELNRQFIEIYGLQDELTPDVPLDEVTILQQGEFSIGKPADCNMSCNSPLVDYDQIEWHEDVVIKQFISYAVGCMMGRYRLDKPGLAIAHPNATEEETAPYAYNGETFTIDDDGIIPLMTKESSFTDNAVNRFKDFVRIALGEKNLAQNLNFVEQSLGKTIEEYLNKNFWDDHKKMYQNRPIYWLFASKKGAFKVIVYMHRMNRYTLERIRSQYLLPHIDYLKTRVESLKQNVADLTGADRKTLKRLETNLTECLEYHDELHEYADRQIEFDLDDGVVNNLKLFGNVVVSPK